MDMDAPWIRRPPNPNLEFIGADYSTVESDLAWTLDADGMYLAPGVMRFKAGWTMFKGISEQAFDLASYNLECFNCVGPRAITSYVKQHRRELELAGFSIIPNFVLYPKGWQKAHELVTPVSEPQKQLAEIAKKSWSIHLFGKMTNHLPIQSQSVISSSFDLYTLRIPRPLGRLSTSTSEMEAGTNLGKGLELRTPTIYRNRSRVSLMTEEEPNLELLGSLDGSFEGTDVIFIRGSQNGYVEEAEIYIHTSGGGKIVLSSPVARIRGGDGLAEGSTGGGYELGLKMKDTNMRDINAILASLVYTPANVHQRQDTMVVRVVYGREQVKGEIKIEM